MEIKEKKKINSMQKKKPTSQKEQQKDENRILVKKKKILEAVNILRQLSEGRKKPQLLEEDEEIPIFIQVILKKIPSRQNMKTLKISLPHTLLQDSAEVCLLTGDLEKSNNKADSEPVVQHYKDLLKENGVSRVNEVIPLRQLRTEYKTYEARRQLFGAYDRFLCDTKIAGVLPKLLGKMFFKKRKFPIQVNLSKESFPSQINKALSMTVCNLSCLGNSCASEIARMGMEDMAIIENVMAFLEKIPAGIPGEWSNISELYLKTAKSQAIPIYISHGEGSLPPRKRNRENAIEDELSTYPNANVRVLHNGTVILKKIKQNE